MEKKLNVKQYTLMAIVFAAIFAIYNIIVLLFISGKNNIYWISYGFMCGAFVIDTAIVIFSMRKLDAEAIFMGIPLLHFSVFYFFAELFASFVFMLFRNHASTKVTISIQIIMLLIYIIFAALAILTRDTVQAIDQNIKTKVAGIKMMSVDVKILEEQCMDPELKKELHKVEEKIRFSDPMDTEITADLDQLIKSKISELKYQCNSNDKNGALQSCYQLTAYISERNQKLILTK